jgi:hypothetical protein
MLFAPTVIHLPLFDDTSNGLVVDPLGDEALRRHVNPWSDLEKCVFVDKFLQYPKNFAKISLFLARKDARECVRFYYDSKKDVDYKVRKTSTWSFSLTWHLLIFERVSLEFCFGILFSCRPFCASTSRGGGA